MTPALSAWIESPDPGISTSTTVSAWSMMSTSAWPTPTVSSSTRSRPEASISSAACSAASLSPPSAPRLAIERMNTPGIEEVVGEADPVAEQGALGERRRGVDREHGDRPLPLALELRDRVRAASTCRRPGGPVKPMIGGPPGLRIDLADELPALGIVVLDERDRPRQRAPVAVEQALGEGLVGAAHAAPAIMPGSRGPSRRILRFAAASATTVTGAPGGRRSTCRSPARRRRSAGARWRSCASPAPTTCSAGATRAGRRAGCG